MNLVQLMKTYDYQPQGKIKLVRHTRQEGKDIELIYKNGLLNEYQRVQSNSVFDTCDFVMSFIATEGDKCVFVGTYKSGSKIALAEAKKSYDILDIGMPELYKDSSYFYDMYEVDFMSDLKDRLIINWGKNSIAWHQYLVEKEVVEILPAGYTKEFPGFDDLVLSYFELKTIVENKDANREWHRQLSSVAGVYLILDTVTGMQYIGSAYGKEGILGRWTSYVNKGHGDNQQLITLLDGHSNRYKDFQFSILKILPTALIKDDVLMYESLYKQKLGTRTFGLNSN